MPPKKMDLTGQRFGRLVAITIGEPRGNLLTWDCRCDCGEECNVPTQYLRSGRTKSCGCYRREMSWARPEKTKKTSENAYQYNVWRNIAAKTLDTAHPKWSEFGGQGIRLCDRWRDFAQFVKDVGPRPSIDHVLDRTDNKGDYTPNNYGWVRRRAKANNRRNNVLVTWEDVTMSVSRWAEELGVSPELLRSRMRAEWPVARVLTENIDQERLDGTLERHRDA